MRKILPLFFILFVFSALSLNPVIHSGNVFVTPETDSALSQNKIEADQDVIHSKAEDPTVYITKTGKKYHRDGCRYLKKSKIAIKLSEAKRRGYKPCKVCEPPT